MKNTTERSKIYLKCAKNIDSYPSRKEVNYCICPELCEVGYKNNCICNDQLELFPEFSLFMPIKGGNIEIPWWKSSIDDADENNNQRVLVMLFCHEMCK